MKIRLNLHQVLLILLLLASQQMGIAHAYTHLHDSLHPTSQDQNLPGEQSCDQCLAFVSIGSALTSPSIAFFAVVATDTKLVADPGKRFTPVTVVPFDAQAPPYAT